MCRSVHDTPPCDKCFPQVHEYNKGIFELYNEVAGQFIMGMGGAVDLNIMAVAWVMDRMGVDEGEQLELCNRVRYFASLVLAEINRDAKKKVK